jgi:hypothetical protein
VIIIVLYALPRWQPCSKRKLSWTHHLQKVQKGRKAAVIWQALAEVNAGAHHPVAATVVVVL